MKTEYLTAKDIRYQLVHLRQLTFEVTDACNLKCKYCAYGELYNDYDERQDNYISLPAALRVLDYLVALWNSQENTQQEQHVFISFYGGEPLMNMPFIMQVVDYIEKKHCPNRYFSFSMTTNAILLERYMDYLVEHDFHLLISLDGNEYNSSYRVNHAGKSAFSTIVKNIEQLQKEHPNYFKKNINFNAVLHNRNSVQEIYEFIKGHYSKMPSIGELNATGIRPDKIKQFQLAYRNAEKSLHQSEHYEKIEHDLFMNTASYQSVASFLHQYSGHVYSDYPELLFGHYQKTIPSGTCLPFGKRMFITVNGKILPCEKIGQHFALGYVSESEIHLDLNEIAIRYNDYYAKIDRQCKRCYSTRACKQCIFNINDLDGSPICHGFMNEQSFKSYQAIQMDFLRKNPEDYYRIMEEVVLS